MDTRYFTESLGEAESATAVITLTVSFAHTWPEGNQISHILFVETRRTRGLSSERGRIGRYNAGSMTSLPGYPVEFFPN